MKDEVVAVVACMILYLCRSFTIKSFLRPFAIAIEFEFGLLSKGRSREHEFDIGHFNERTALHSERLHIT